MTPAPNDRDGGRRPPPDALDDRRWNDRLRGAILAILTVLALVAGVLLAARWLLAP